MQASVCIFGMQNLSVSDYVILCRLYYRLYKDNKITERMLEQALFPNFLESKIISVNFNNPSVAALQQSKNLAKQT